MDQISKHGSLSRLLSGECVGSGLLMSPCLRRRAEQMRGRRVAAGWELSRNFYRLMIGTMT
jgi:hypothetical protein